ncbi:YbjQ family protein [Alteromonas sp. BMJM2]|uniref:YbjQ family protein n=1 Tax=Alteromonas sp. BMJM2 TaxID=2954241 RepID=UPI0022B4CE30|nr:heavy metal-binding domain-containing protein [Alteromonas sp. BMJM2]
MCVAETKLDDKSIENVRAINNRRIEERKQVEEAQRKASLDTESRKNEYDHIILTTESISPFTVRKRLGIVTAEYVYRFTISSGFAAAIDSIGEIRHSSMQNTLQEARSTALVELRREAYKLGADAVVAVDLDYSEISVAGTPLMFLVASGTAIEIEK